MVVGEVGRDGQARNRGNLHVDLAHDAHRPRAHALQGGVEIVLGDVEGEQAAKGFYAKAGFLPVEQVDVFLPLPFVGDPAIEHGGVAGQVAQGDDARTDEIGSRVEAHVLAARAQRPLAREQIEHAGIREVGRPRGDAHEFALHARQPLGRAFLSEVLEHEHDLVVGVDLSGLAVGRERARAGPGSGKDAAVGVDLVDLDDQRGDAAP